MAIWRVASRFNPMHGIKDRLVAGAALCGFGLSLYVLFANRRDGGHGGAHSARSAQPALGTTREIEELQKQLAGLRAEVSNVAATSRSASSPTAAGAPSAGDRAAMDARLLNLEARLLELQSAMEGVSLEKASTDRAALFAGEEGYLKADEYLEAGKFAIAGEGYLTFLEHHPDHADARDVLKKARDAFLKAGYTDKAFWVHEEMMKHHPDHRSNDLWEQAQLEKQAGRYDAAVDHAAEAAELATTAEERLWRRLYWAWFVQLRDGTPAGIAALDGVQREIAAAGVSNPKLAQRAREKMLEMQQQAQTR
jgi:hypothetical protein